MVFDRTDTKLSSFINEAGVDDLSTIASQLFTRVAALDEREQDQFIQQIQRDPEAKRVFERMQSYSR